MAAKHRQARNPRIREVAKTHLAMTTPTPVHERLRPWRLGAAVAVLAALAALAGLPAAAAATEYSPPHLNDSYVSETHFDDKGMGPLYGLAVDFLRAIQQPEPLPPSESPQYWHCTLWSANSDPRC